MCQITSPDQTKACSGCRHLGIRMQTRGASHLRTPPLELSPRPTLSDVSYVIARLFAVAMSAW